MTVSVTRRILLGVSLLVVMVGAAPVLAKRKLDSAPYKRGEVIVKYKEGVTRLNTLMDDLYQKVGVRRVERLSSSIYKNFEILKLNAGVGTRAAVAILKKMPFVEYAQLNYTLRLPRGVGLNRSAREGIPCIPGMDVPNCDPKLCWIPGVPLPPGCTDWGGGQPGDPGNPGGGRPDLKEPPAEVNPPVADPQFEELWGMKKIQADEAWKAHRGAKEIVVAVIDTGLDYNHEDISFNVWRNPNPTRNDIVGFDFIHNDGLPFDDQGHGTHTSGTVGAVGENGVAIAGVSPKVSVMALKFLSAQGSGSTADAIKAIDYAVEHGAKILSNSWGGPADPGNQALYDSIERAKAKDVLFIAAAGNDGKNNDNANEASYPAAFDNDNLIAVAASDDKDGMAFFSNYGKQSTDLAAPGVNIYSSLPGNQYKKYSGTSMACPHVAGAAALLWSRKPEWTYKQVKEALLNSVDKVSAFDGKVLTGGRLNVLKALRSTE